MLIAARDTGVPRVVFASSSSVYGDTPTLPKVETMTPSPLSPYAVTKLTGEYVLQGFIACTGWKRWHCGTSTSSGHIRIRPLDYAAVIPLFISLMARGERPKIQGDGTQSRDFTYIDNVVHAHLRAAEAPDVGGEVFNVAVGRATRCSISSRR